ncbi:hydroxyacyl-coenzyme A dehydrogenase, mitochondrial-like isoform X2 [Homarus americanus]|uniref:hydroxyacyl-coenzyme A dehydrogenase, mitochondrial-like isoform X2 n=1 Tax=Homarus americanus TaxID=6706 RepID=UPI001C454A3D|nr:hydroxyacyl-coenzyme A dehydrogenase, mitochondrial-like isoform X2 [Homarus americanus]
MALFNSLSTRTFSQSARMSAAIQNVTVIGSGLMGAGIAQVAAQTGHKVTMVDIDDAAVEKAQKRIGDSIQRIAKKKFGGESAEANKFISDAIGRLTISTDAVSSVGSADLVVEAIVENLDVKKKLFTQLDQAAPSHTIFASNTSSLSIAKIADATNRKDRFGGLHFFNPVPVMKLLEIVRISETSEDTYNAMKTFGKNMGKVSVLCKDNPGFIANRLVVPYLLSAVRMVERGDATTRDVDTALKLGGGFPMGPFELFDHIGIDTLLFVSEHWEKLFPDDQAFKVPPTLTKLVKEGKFGKKSGEGFYKYGN